MTHFGETLWQNMFQKPINKLLGRERDLAGLLGAVIAITESDFTLVESLDPAIWLTARALRALARGLHPFDLDPLLNGRPTRTAYRSLVWAPFYQGGLIPVGKPLSREQRELPKTDVPLEPWHDELVGEMTALIPEAYRIFRLLQCPVVQSRAVVRRGFNP
jgi:hypothetical protein